MSMTLLMVILRPFVVVFDANDGGSVGLIVQSFSTVADSTKLGLNATGPSRKIEQSTDMLC